MDEDNTASSSDTQTANTKSTKTPRRERLAEALRSNLRRRKQQAKDRRAAERSDFDSKSPPKT